MSRVKSNKPLVSVVIPTYNGEEFLEEAIDSVLNQTFTDFELIFCDDASKDGTPHILDSYSRSDSRISVFTFSENTGLAGNWNRGMKKARGVYIKILCQDDLLKPTYLEEAVAVLETKSSVSLLCSFEKTIGSASKIRSFDDFPGSGELKGTLMQEHVIHNGNWIGAPTATLFRREDTSKIGLFDEDIPCSLDWEMWLRFLGLGNLYVIPKILYSTRIHSNQETSNCIQNLGFYKDRISIMRKLENQPELYGRKDWKISRKIYLQAVNRLIFAAADKEPAKISDVVRFLNQYQSALATWAAVAKVFLLRSVKYVRSIVKPQK